MKKMLKKNKPLVIAGLLVLVALVAYFSRDSWMNLLQQPKGKDAKLVINTVSNPSNTATNVITDDTLLHHGIKAKEKVKELQILLNQKQQAAGQSPLLVVDGDFGNKTQAMLRTWTGKTSISINNAKTLLGGLAQSNPPNQYTWN